MNNKHVKNYLKLPPWETHIWIAICVFKMLYLRKIASYLSYYLCNDNLVVSFSSQSFMLSILLQLFHVCRKNELSSPSLFLVRLICTNIVHAGHWHNFSWLHSSSPQIVAIITEHISLVGFTRILSPNSHSHNNFTSNRGCSFLPADNSDRRTNKCYVPYSFIYLKELLLFRKLYFPKHTPH